MTDVERWRLILGKYSGQCLGVAGAGTDQARMEAAMDFLYGHEYDGRGVRQEGSVPSPQLGPGGLGDSMPTLVSWLGEIRELFPRQTAEIVEKHALDRYGMTELVTDPQTLERLVPDEQLLKTILMLKGQMDPEVLAVARRIIREVVDELRRKLEADVRRALSGRLNQHRHSPMRLAANFDAVGTIRRNLKNYDAESGRLVLDKVLFFERNARRLPWDIIVCVDQSGSMVGSVIHSAVMAGILAGLPAFRVRLVVFDTNVVDLSDAADDPVEVLLSAQLGGGTDIAKAVRYCGQLVENPDRTVLVLVTDFCEGGSPADLVRAVRELAEARVTMLGLAALDREAHPYYDKQMAQRLANHGMRIAALTPSELANWLTEVTA